MTCLAERIVKFPGAVPEDAVHGPGPRLLVEQTPLLDMCLKHPRTYRPSPGTYGGVRFPKQRFP